MTLCYAHTSVPCLVVIRDTSSYGSWNQIQRPTAGQCAESVTCGTLSRTCDVTINSLSPGLRKPCREGDRMNV